MAGLQPQSSAAQDGDANVTAELASMDDCVKCPPSLDWDVYGAHVIEHRK